MIEIERDSGCRAWLITDDENPVAYDGHPGRPGRPINELLISDRVYRHLSEVVKDYHNRLRGGSKS